jgi:hypothetical protein
LGAVKSASSFRACHLACNRAANHDGRV